MYISHLQCDTEKMLAVVTETSKDECVLEYFQKY